MQLVQKSSQHTEVSIQQQQLTHKGNPQSCKLGFFPTHFLNGLNRKFNYITIQWKVIICIVVGVTTHMLKVKKKNRGYLRKK